ncbi:hypothetical protein EVAR_2297_1 [Eumeta japonica]|uniref:Uncharacterized protein n=1 Tax=Eumeta variegata TaxID=151549 RepID=A0A4C1SII0_EUMVA|nr:hypothetical protein EVAR_2297_1 [Eumeta japonica]
MRNPLFAPQSGDSCLFRVLALGHLLFVFTSWYDSTKLARIETSCSEIGRIRNQLFLPTDAKTVAWELESHSSPSSSSYAVIPYVSPQHYHDLYKYFAAAHDRMSFSGLLVRGRQIHKTDGWTDNEVIL